MKYEVIVGNIGSVYRGGDEKIALNKFKDYVADSKGGYGRAAGEDVTLMESGEISKEFVGKLSLDEINEIE